MATIEEALRAALDHHQAGRLEEAETLYGRILAVAPDQPETLHFAGVLAAQTGRMERAVGLLTRAAAARPDHAGFQTTLANALNAAGRLEEAEARYARALEIDPVRAEAWIAAGQIRERLGRHADALDSLSRAHALLPGDGALALDLARLLQADGVRRQNAGDAGAAEARYREALALRPELAPARFGLGQLLHAAGKVEEAAACFAGVAARDPSVREAHLALAEIREGQGRHAEAAGHLREALALAPGETELRFRLARQLQAAGIREEALAEYDAVLAARPDLSPAHANRARLLVDMGDPGRAAGAAPHLLAIRPADAGEWYGIAHLLADLGAWDDLARHLARMIRERNEAGLFWKSPYYVALDVANRLWAAGRPDDVAAMVAALRGGTAGIDPAVDGWLGFLEGCVALRRGDAAAARALFDAVTPEIPVAGQIPLGGEFEALAAQGARRREEYGGTVTWAQGYPDTGGRPFVLAAADSDYVERFAPLFLASVAAFAEPGQVVHFHVVDPTSRTEQVLRELAAAHPGVRLGISRERLEKRLVGGGRTTYLTCVRFLRLPGLMSLYRSPCVVADIDAAFLADPALFAAGLTAERPAALLYGPENLAAPYDAVGGGILALAQEPAALSFARGAADFLLHWFGEGLMAYFLDQVALVAAAEARLGPDRIRRIHASGRRLYLDGAGFVQILQEKSEPAFAEAMAGCVARLRAGDGLPALEGLFGLPPS